jgi:hypothetical protein
MDVALFLFFSALEWLALILLSFTMFKLQIRGFRGQIILSAFLLSLFSYILFVTLRVEIVATLIQPLIVFLIYWQIFRISIFYAGLIVVDGYLGYDLVQSAIFTTFQKAGISIQPDSLPTFLLQTATAAISLGLAWVIYKKGLGFTFVPFDRYSSVKIRGINLALLVFTFIGYIAVASFNYLFYSTRYSLLLVILALAFGGLQYWVFKKEFMGE